VARVPLMFRLGSEKAEHGSRFGPDKRNTVGIGGGKTEHEGMMASATISTLTG
jgi:hypothetical protein